MVNENKVACVNILPTITSIYRWENELQIDENESLMIMKTRTATIDELIEFIRHNHPYSVPEIIFTAASCILIFFCYYWKSLLFIIIIDYGRKS